jgi:two-component SAPR family response regulator
MGEDVRVLVVEDDPSLREVLLEVLANEGWHVVAASRGEEALARAREERFDLILADIRMDGINGLDTIEQARELQPDIGSIVVSGFASEEETLRAVKLNVAGYLKKPFKMPELMELIGRFLAARQEKRRHEGDLKAAREAFLWALEQWALGQAQAAHLSRGCQLIHGLGVALGYPQELARQLSLGGLLGELLTEQELPEEVDLTLAAFPLLVGALTKQTSAEVATFALRLCHGLPQDAPWPAPDSLPESTSPKLKEAYAAFLGGDGRLPSRTEGINGLLSLGRTLEHGGDWEGAARAFADAAQQAGISPQAVQSLLGQARVAMARGQTASLESSVAELLNLAESLGPVTLATAELEAAEVLRKAGHPAARKLCERASKSLAAVGLGVPWARVVLALHVMGSTADQGALMKALSLLAARSHRWEVLEHLETLLPDLLRLCPDHGEAVKLAADLVREDSEEVAGQLRRGRLDTAAKSALLGLLDSELTSLPGALLLALQSDPDQEIRAVGLALGAKLGRSESKPILRVTSLGTLEVRIGDERLDDKSWKTQKTKYLFARLVDSAPRALSVERLMEDFWSGSSDSARNNLNTAVSLIRRHLNGASRDPVLRHTETLALNPDMALWHDADELEKAALTAQRHLEAGHLDGALAHFARVARLYGGAYLDGCYMDWALERRNQLENRVAFALEQLASHRQNQHRYREALEYALTLLQLQPENTVGHDVTMRAYLATDRHQKAVAHYESYEARLAADGLEPPTELVRSYQMARYGFQPEGPGLTGG